MFSLIYFQTKSLTFEIYQSVYVTLILKELKSRESDFSTLCDTFYRVPSSLGFYNITFCVMLYFIFTKTVYFSCTNLMEVDCSEVLLVYVNKP